MKIEDYFCIKSLYVSDSHNFIEGKTYTRENITEIYYHGKNDNLEYFYKNFSEYFISTQDFRDKKINTILS